MDGSTPLKQDTVPGTPQLAVQYWREIHEIAEHMFRKIGPSDTLQPTALANEACLRMLKSPVVAGTHWESKTHFLAYMTKAIRSALVDHARRRRLRLQGERTSVRTGDDSQSFSIDLENLDAAMTRFEKINTRAHRAIELRYFGGLGVAETAAMLDVSVSTVESDWRRARAWLARELNSEMKSGEREQDGRSNP